MKFTKFIPTVCAFAFATSMAFAAPVNQLSAEYTVEVPELFTITQEALTNTVSDVTETDALDSISWTGAMGATYKVVTNKPGKVFYIKATAQGATVCKAFNTDVNAIKVAFANSTVPPTDEAIADVLKASPTAANSPNAFAVDLTLGAITADAGVLPAPSMTNQELVYTVTNPGTFHIPFTMATTASGNTFSSHDAAGAYKATITITDVAS